MFGARFKVFTLAGFKVYVDLSWFIIALLVTWSLAEGVFRNAQVYPELVQQPGMRWAMGAAGALLFFLSIVLHEFGHAITARKFGLHIRGITLFIFGGVAELSDEPPNAKAEFWVAIAGPAVSVALGVMFLGLAFLPLPLPIRAVTGYLGMINFVSPGWRAHAARSPVGGPRQLALGHANHLAHRRVLRHGAYRAGRVRRVLYQQPAGWNLVGVDRPFPSTGGPNVVSAIAVAARFGG